MRQALISAIPYAVGSLVITVGYVSLPLVLGHPPATIEQTVEHAGTWVGAVVVLWAAFVAVQQLKDARRAARATTFLEIMQRYQSEKMQSARAHIFGVRTGVREPGESSPLDPAHIKKHADLEASCLTVCRFYEEVGTIVRFDGLEFEMVNSYLHTRIIKAYQRLKLFIAIRRKDGPERGSPPNPYAWNQFEWLALQCIAHPPGPDPEWVRMRNRYPSHRVVDTTVGHALPPPLSGSPAP